MSAWFRRRGATCDAIQYDGTNDEECAKLADCPVESIAKGVRVGQWLVMGHDAFLYQLDDDRFRERYEPVPLPEPAPADGWVRVEDGLPELTKAQRKPNAIGVEVMIDPPMPWDDYFPSRVAFFGCRQTDEPNFYLYGRVLDHVKRWRHLPAPPVVEGGK